MEDVGVTGHKMHKLNLRKLILILAVFGVVVTLLNAFYSIYRVQHDLIISNTIESNRVYAEKMANMTDVFIDTAMSQLEYSATILSDNLNDENILQQEVDRLKTQTDSFNSVVIVNTNGVIVAVSPETLQVKGVTLAKKRSSESLRKSPSVTDPFISPAGNLLTSLSYPIYSAQGEYLGYVAGTIYLEEKNILREILGKHSYQDGSQIYVVDRNRTVIYHQNEQRIGQVITNNAAINAVTQGQKGGMAIVNSQGIDMLAGYASVEATGWGIVAQRSENRTLADLNEQMKRVLYQSLPVVAVTLLVIWVSSVFISKPLWQLASVVKEFEDHSSTVSDLTKVKPWYFEASHLKQSFLSTFSIVSNTIDQLHLDTMTDAMTGLANRRGLDKAIESMRERNVPFAVLALDVDHFKWVNDTFGHDAGDSLLVNVAGLIKAQARKVDVVCRAGGEEFIVFLTKADAHQAVEVAERIRTSIESQQFDVVGHVTISIGVASWSGIEEPINAVLKKADDALYAAKHNGRNRTEWNSQKHFTS